MKRFLGLPATIVLVVGTASAQTPAAAEQTPPPALAGMQSTGPGGAQNPFLGGIPIGKPTPDALPLSLAETLRRGLNHNLGSTLSAQSIRTARGIRQLALSQLLPNITAGLTETQQQVNLDAFGFQGFPGVRKIVGPFNVFDVRAYVNQSVLDFAALNNYRATKQNVAAAELSHEDAREMVAFVCANLYLQALASSSRIEATRAQVKTARVLYDLAVDQKAAGVSPGIEVLRAQVELQAQQQRLIVAEDQYAKDKLTLARAIGLPLGQEFTLTDAMSFIPLPPLSLEEAIERAHKDRPDLGSAAARVRAAELERKAAKATRLPTVDLGADYGDIGQRPWGSHGTFTVTTALRVPIFQGGSVGARVLEADAALRQRQAELDDLRARVYYDVRNAFLDLQAAADRVQVAESAIKLAEQQVVQSEDRFRAGVTNNVEVVQAQEALATASENRISSLHAHNAAKLALARAIGISENGYEQFLRGK